MALLFSQHASNPLEVSSSKVHNSHYLKHYTKAAALNTEFAALSDNPLYSYSAPEVNDWRSKRLLKIDMTNVEQEKRVDELCDDEDLVMDEELRELEEYDVIKGHSTPLSDTMTDEEHTLA